MGRRYYIDPDTGEEVYIRDKVPSLAQYRKAADQDEIDEEISRDLVNKITAPSNPQVGKILKILSVNDDGTFTCGWADDADTHPVDDVQLNGTSVVSNGVATIPINASRGITYATVNGAKVLCTQRATDDEITARNGNYKCIVPSNIVKAVDSVLCSTAESEKLDADKQLAARQRIGIDQWETIEKIEVNNDTATSITRNSYGSNIPYNFPALRVIIVIDNDALVGNYGQIILRDSRGTLLANFEAGNVISTSAYNRFAMGIYKSLDSAFYTRWNVAGSGQNSVYHRIPFFDLSLESGLWATKANVASVEIPPITGIAKIIIQAIKA